MADCRDDITAQANNRRKLRQCAKQPEELDKFLQHLGRSMTVHLEDMMARIRDIAGPSAAPGAGGDGTVRPDAGAAEQAHALIHAATEARRLSAQDPSFHPWF